jgi:hypothetical protein
MMPKGITMENKTKSIDPLPESFETEEEAGAFWMLIVRAITKSI